MLSQQQCEEINRLKLCRVTGEQVLELHAAYEM